MKNKKRKTLTIEQKVKIIHELEINKDQSILVKRGIASSSVISRIWTNRLKIIASSMYRPKKAKRIKESLNPELDHTLLLWFKEQRRNNVPISGQVLLENANMLAKKINILDFNCTNGWIDRFKWRHSLSFRNICGESNTVNLDIVKNWLDNEWPKLQKEYKNSDIFNGDETGLFYRCTPNKTLKFIGENCSGGKLSKERLTIWICASIDGEKKKLVFIGKQKNPRCFKNQDISKYDYYNNKRAWMTAQIFNEELVKWDSELRMINRKILLLVDNCGPHTSINASLTHIKLVFLPANTTSVLQPMDQGVIRTFKSHYRKFLITKMLQCIERKEEFTVSILDALRISEIVWCNIPKEIITNCFIKSGITNLNLSEKKICLLQNDTANIFEDDFSDIFKNSKEIEQFIDVDLDIQTVETFDLCNDEIINNDKDFSDDTVIENNKITIQEAIEGFRKAINFYSNENITITIINAINQIEIDLDERFLKQRTVQRKITDYCIMKDPK